MLISPHWSCGHKPTVDKLVHIQRDYEDTLKTTAISSFIIQETKNIFLHHFAFMLILVILVTVY